MKLRNTNIRAQDGGIVLLIIVALSCVLVITMMGYLLLLTSQHRLVSRSMAWNTSLTMAEAGVEDGLAQINNWFSTNYTSSANTNWGLSNGAYGPKTQTLSGGSYSAIIITTNGVCPTIIATGYAAVSYNLTPVKRVVQVETTNTPVFIVAMAVQNNITTKGNKITIDSYDSSDPNHSTNGLYDAATRMAGGDVASQAGFVNIQNANVYGKLLTGPDGSYSVGAGGSVGDLNWNTGGQIQPGYYRNDLNMTFKDVDPPYSSGVTPLAVNSGTNTYVLGSSDYYVGGDFTINNNETLYVSGNAKLYITGSFTMKAMNGSYISIAPGASLKVYLGTSSGPAVSATFAQVNTTGNASSFQIYGLPSLQSATWGGNANYVGVIYAPQTDFSLGGGGSLDMDFQGSCSVSNATMNGHFNFHYDQNLSRLKPGSGFTVTSWREL